MKLIIISDTHEKHDQLYIPNGDVIIHCGDFTNRGNNNKIKNFFKWFNNLPHKHKIVIPGNHENCFSVDSIKRYRLDRYKNLHILINSEIIIDGIKFYGSPMCNGNPNIMSNWNFYVDDENINKYWNLIPGDTDILITHIPPFGILDGGYGCKFLLEKVKHIKPSLHLFGHVHECYGIYDNKHTKFINSSVLNNSHDVVNKAVIIDFLK